MVVTTVMDNLTCNSPCGEPCGDSTLEMMILKWFRMQEGHIYFLLYSNSYYVIVAAHRFVLRGILKLPAGLKKRVPWRVSNHCPAIVAVRESSLWDCPGCPLELRMRDLGIARGRNKQGGWAGLLWKMPCLSPSWPHLPVMAHQGCQGPPQGRECHIQSLCLAVSCLLLIQTPNLFAQRYKAHQEAMFGFPSRTTVFFLDNGQRPVVCLLWYSSPRLQASLSADS